MGVGIYTYDVVPEAWPDLPGPTSCRLQPPQISNRIGQSGRVEKRQFGKRFDALDLEFKFTSSQKMTFDSFFSSTLGGGINWFTASWLDSVGYSSSYCARISGYPRKQMVHQFYSIITFSVVVSLITDLVSLSFEEPYVDDGSRVYFDNTYWRDTGPPYHEATLGFWNGTSWESEERGEGNWAVEIAPIGIWASGFRPTSVFITCTGNTGVPSGWIYGTWPDSGEITANESFPLSLSTDIDSLYIDGSSTKFYISNIIFYVSV